ncbi:MAG TPA: proteasome subunit alpha [Verrucomicrobiales bacterium]|nr:proteasome subunit alpha [Verrucomicrobiales bacterium]
MMNGDFLALLPKSPFAQLTGAGAGQELALHATTVFAFHCAAGVIMAGDHRATAGNTVFSDTTEKILDLDAHSMMAIAGSPAVAFEMARTLQTTFEFYRRSQLQPMSLSAKLRALSKLLRENLPGTIQGFGLVSPLFAGLEVEDPHAQPVIHFYDPLGAQFEAATFASSGSGSPTIRSVLHFLEKWGNPRPADMTLEQAVNLANRLLMTAAAFDTATGGVHPDRRLYATIKLLTRDGIRTIPLEEHERYWQRADT